MKIIATTDLSENSKAGVLFALSLAQSASVELIVLHIHYMLRASTWTDAEYNGYLAKCEGNMIADLECFMSELLPAETVGRATYRLALHQCLDIVEGIVDYSQQHSVDYVCISTQGAGTLGKIIGTNTSKLIAKSAVPVLCIPSIYSAQPVHSILYASDMQDYEAELMQVAQFAKPLNASIQMMHLAYHYEEVPDTKQLALKLSKQSGCDVTVIHQGRNTEASVLEDIIAAVDQYQPSLVAMFSHTDRDFIDRLLSSGNVMEYSFHAKTPLLCMNKRNKDVTGASKEEVNFGSVS